MKHIIDIVIANPALFSALAALVLSEALPFVKGTRAEGLVHGLLMLFKKEAPKDGAP